jgi:mannosyltransferase OCH1-like enzyme
MFQTSKAMRVPVLLRQAMQSIIDVNPSMEHRYFTDEMQEEYVRLKATPAVLKAYLTLVPHAFRSDLFRYVYLYNEGGCYFDSDFVAATTFEHVIDEEVEFVSAEDNGIGFLYNALMCSAPRHPLMRLALNMSVTRILAHFYDHSALSITGPGLFGDAFDQLYGQRPREFRRPARGVLLLSYRRTDECGCGHISDAEGRHYFATAYPEFRTEMKAYHRQRPYWTYVEQRAVYTDGEKTLPEEPAKPDAEDVKA